MHKPMAQKIVSDFGDASESGIQIQDSIGDFTPPVYQDLGSRNPTKNVEHSDMVLGGGPQQSTAFDAVIKGSTLQESNIQTATGTQDATRPYRRLYIYVKPTEGHSEIPAKYYYAIEKIRTGDGNTIPKFTKEKISQMPSKNLPKVGERPKSKTLPFNAGS